MLPDKVVNKKYIYYNYVLIYGWHHPSIPLAEWPPQYTFDSMVIRICENSTNLMDIKLFMSFLKDLFSPFDQQMEVFDLKEKNTLSILFKPPTI